MRDGQFFQIFEVVPTSKKTPRKKKRSFCPFNSPKKLSNEGSELALNHGTLDTESRISEPTNNNSNDKEGKQQQHGNGKRQNGVGDW